MGWFSAVKRVSRAATSVATAPTRITAAVASRVLPKSIGRAVSAAATFNPGTYAVNRAKATVARPFLSRPSAPAPAARMFSSFQPAAPPRPSFFDRAANALTNPTASPSSGAIMSPAAVQAAVAQQSPTQAYVPPAASTSWSGGGGGSGYDDGGAYDEEGSDEGDGGDPTEDMPPEFFDAADDGAGGADLGDIDYHAALEGLGDWKSDLLSFGKQAGASVAKQAATAIGNKLTASGKPAAPPPAASGLSTGAKVAIGGAVALGVGYLAFGRRRAPSSAT